jgi:hypothetical protein
VRRTGAAVEMDVQSGCDTVVDALAGTCATMRGAPMVDHDGDALSRKGVVQIVPSLRADAQKTAVRPAVPRSIVPPSATAAIGSAC